MTTSHAPASTSIDEALMRFPYQEWIEMHVAAGHVRDLGLPSQALTTVVRTGRRRGVLRTRREPGQRETYVMRVTLGPHRRPRPATN